VTVQKDLSRERWMPADLDGDVPPFWIEDMKGVVIHVRDWLSSFEMMIRAGVPHGGLRTADQDEKHPSRNLSFGQVFFGNVVFAIPDGTFDDGNVVCFGITVNAPTEAAGHPHQVHIFQCVVRSGQRSPPEAEPAWIMPHAKIAIQNDPIDAIVTADKKLSIEISESVCHSREDYWLLSAEATPLLAPDF